MTEAPSSSTPDASPGITTQANTMGAEPAPELGEPLTKSEEVPKKKSKIVEGLKKVWDLVCEQWFILGLGFAIGFAAAVPDFGRNGGWIAAQWTIKYGAVIIIFFLSGCSLKTRALVNAAARLHVHLFIQSICLVVTPAIGYGISRALATSSMNSDLVNGLVVAMVMPTTISTNVVFTKQAGGNEAAALINAVIGNLIGIFVSPGWLKLYLGKSGQAPYEDIIQTLAITIIAPLVVGQLVQYFLPDYVKKAQEYINFGKVGNLMIILLVWNTFCNTFYKDIQLSASSWVPMLFLLIGMFLFFSALCVALATFVPFKKVFKFDKPDAVAVIMCGSTKTLALGMPLITVMYGKSPNAGILSLPLIIYHATQCLLGSVMVPRIRSWVDSPSPGAWPASAWHPPPPLAEQGADGAAAKDSAAASPGSSGSSHSGTATAAAGSPARAEDADLELGGKGDPKVAGPV